MLTDKVPCDDAESTSRPADETDDSCRLEYIEIVPLTRGIDWSAEVQQETLPVVKQEPEDVCSVVGCVVYTISLQQQLVQTNNNKILASKLRRSTCKCVYLVTLINTVFAAETLTLTQ